MFLISIGAPIGPMPTSSKVNYGDQTPKLMKYDLWIVGCGTLGTLIANQWKAKYPDANIIAETRFEFSILDKFILFTYFIFNLMIK